jgi:hypothetical protein
MKKTRRQRRRAMDRGNRAAQRNHQPASCPSLRKEILSGLNLFVDPCLQQHSDDDATLES